MNAPPEFAALCANLARDLERGDARAFAARFSRDGELVACNGARAVGRVAVARLAGSAIVTPPAGGAIAVEVLGATMHGSDVAVVRLVSSRGGSHGHGFAICVLRRHGGRWSVASLRCADVSGDGAEAIEGADYAERLSRNRR